MAKKGLGRGLSALIPDEDMEFLSRVARGDDSVSVEEAIPAPETLLQETPKAQSNGDPTWIAVASIEANPYQPRRTFSPVEMEDLTGSIRQHGIIQPILVRPAGEDGSGARYQLIAGERRWRAAQAAGLEMVPAVIRAVDDQQALELAVIENVQRHDISALDAARAYRRLGQEFGLSQEDIARRVGKSRPVIANTVRLLDLPEEAQGALEDGTLSEGHGRAILLAPGEGARRAVFRLIIRDKLTVREAEAAARRALDTLGSVESEKSDGQAAAAAPQEYQDLAKQLSRSLGTKVSIRHRNRGGEIRISYFSAADLERLAQRLHQ